ncbi:dimethylarginine dimethylaminohydrolase family protein [Streptomyces stelliscabiei]|uniref:N-dimethylarginine dimethylaminohydrolase n=1 Tax=Streptomyces stelliscabiei TaxID=146820 RepID=A0A8I0P8Q1_9ACTN|nr:arginine deiminase-related protein [Streptomyces stelliscabiei]KND42884.1 amidinotransferase [Streptomyces stelliscabiei]MBE1601856.1 N-dimethylarginine dimethylaminohydrolase [Streptomyces stelliscabiei]MDX2514082.1 arginine deiminase-related protein [Streptomyces stelliscabiei]MDX2553460.1 arginine deiminase-related protein [Streptomyces stelliscabiei]MDX2612496.1 arginine deiminase-related protein [Streptomyces stelliscabiei]
MNSELLVSDVSHFRVDYEINPYMDTAVQPDIEAAHAEHQAIVAAHLAAGRKVEYVPSAPDCPDMVFTANAALVRGERALLGSPPPERKAEVPYFAEWLADRGFEVIEAPYAFSGQGDALAYGDQLLTAYGQRTDERMLRVLARELDYEVVPLRTAGCRWYDLDLAVGVIAPGLLAYCPDALDAPSLRTLRGLGADLVEVSAEEAARFALNLVSDGTTVTMTRGAPLLAAALRDRGLDVVELDTTELAKGGGGVRCTALTLDNPPARQGS